MVLVGVNFFVGKSVTIYAGDTTYLAKESHKLDWKNISNQRAFLEDCAAKLNIVDISRWYKITGQDLKQYGGEELLKLYNYIPSRLLTTVFPEYLD